jgi:hypothetical protein
VFDLFAAGGGGGDLAACPTGPAANSSSNFSRCPVCAGVQLSRPLPCQLPMSDDEPIDPEALLAMVAEMTVWASPGLVVDDFHPDLRALAILTVAPSFICTSRRLPMGAMSP